MNRKQRRAEKKKRAKGVGKNATSLAREILANSSTKPALLDAHISPAIARSSPSGSRSWPIGRPNIPSAQLSGTEQKQIVAATYEVPKEFHFPAIVRTSQSMNRLTWVNPQRGSPAKKGDAATYVSRGDDLFGQRHFAEALASYDSALALRPDYVEALNNRGVTLWELQRFDEALASYDRALAVEPDYVEALSNRGNALIKLQRHDEALASYSRALAVRPNHAEALNNCGNVLKELNRLDEALANYDRALALRPEYAEAHCNRGVVLCELKRLDEAVASYDRALVLRPDYAEAHFNRGSILLLAGDAKTGWPELEWRWLMKASPSGPLNSKTAFWSGEELEGRHLLVFSEQGAGDVILFARCLPFMAQKGCHITFQTSEKLVRMLRPLTSGIEVISAPGTGQKFDFQCPLMSLPYLLKTDLASISTSIPYLRAEEALVARWRDRIGEQGFKIGIAWQGNPQAANDQKRSIALRQYLALARIPGVRIISLQKVHGLDQLAGLPEDVTIETLGEDFDNGPDAFVDTAAMMDSLDLVLTSDTSIAHLAGALGRPTWVALQYVPHWMWMLDREDSPWYPTMRLFRQSGKGQLAPGFCEDGT